VKKEESKATESKKEKIDDEAPPNIDAVVLKTKDANDIKLNNITKK